MPSALASSGLSDSSDSARSATVAPLGSGPSLDGGPAFSSAPDLGSARDIMSQTPEQLQARINSLLPHEREALHQQLNSPTSREPEVEMTPRGRPIPKPTPTQRAMGYEFGLSLNEFINGPKKQKPIPFDWSDDGCSAPWVAVVIGSPWWNHFFNRACVRHDFGYWNFGTKSHLQIGKSDYSGYRARIDQKLLDDMYSIANGADGAKAAAQIYYHAVRKWGEGSF